MEAGQPSTSGQEPLKVTAEQLGLVVGKHVSGNAGVDYAPYGDQPVDDEALDMEEEYDKQLEFDLGCLCACDPTPFDVAALGEDKNAGLQDIATRMTQSLVARLFSLPSQGVQGGRLAMLPGPVTPLPRARPLPQQKAETKWEKFAKKKGIVKKKRSKLVQDDATGDWKRRFGYKKANDPTEVPWIEAAAGDQGGEDDPFTRQVREKRERIKKNKSQQEDNVKKMAKAGQAIPATLRLAASLPEHGPGGRGTKRKEMHSDIKLASRMAGVSTASIGKFDKRLKGEKDGERAPLGKRRKFLSVTDTAGERSKLTGLTDKFLRERSDDVLDIKRAMGKLEADRRQERYAAKQADGGDEGGDRRGGKGGKGGKGGAGGKGGKGGAGGKGGRAGGKPGGDRKGGKGGFKGGKGGKGAPAAGGAKGGRAGGGKGGNPKGPNRKR